MIYREYFLDAYWSNIDNILSVVQALIFTG